MKRLLILLVILALALTGCRKDEEVTLTAHININDVLIEDSYQVLSIIDEAVENETKPNMDILFDYTDKYLLNIKDRDLTPEETELVLMTSLLVRNANEFITIKSEKKDYEEYKERWFKTLETGEKQ